MLQVKRMFGGTGDGGGQTQILQMVIYFLVIISVITSFDGYISFSFLKENICD